VVLRHADTLPQHHMDLNPEDRDFNTSCGFYDERNYVQPENTTEFRRFYMQFEVCACLFFGLCASPLVILNEKAHFHEM